MHAQTEGAHPRVADSEHVADSDNNAAAHTLDAPLPQFQSEVKTAAVSGLVTGFGDDQSGHEVPLIAPGTFTPAGFEADQIPN